MFFLFQISAEAQQGQRPKQPNLEFAVAHNPLT